MNKGSVERRAGVRDLVHKPTLKEARWSRLGHYLHFDPEAGDLFVDPFRGRRMRRKEEADCRRCGDRLDSVIVDREAYRFTVLMQHTHG